jgi:hypothetical protein
MPGTAGAVSFSIRSSAAMAVIRASGIITAEAGNNDVPQDRRLGNGQDQFPALLTLK